MTLAFPPPPTKLLAAPFVVAGLSLCALTGYLAFTLATTYIRGWRSPLNVLPGPRPTSILMGNFGVVSEQEGARMMENWVHQFGRAYVVQSVLGRKKLLTVDAKALHHIAHHGDLFQRSEQAQHMFEAILGKGLLFAEGPTHRRQRKVINPAFGPVQVRKFTEIFVEKSNELRDIWLDLAAKSTRKDGRVRVNAFSWMNKVTLDIIGLAGFGYEFDSLHRAEDDQDELYRAFSRTINSKRSPFLFVQISIPILRDLPFGPVAESKRSTAIIREKGMELMQAKKKAILDAANGGSMEKADFGNDLISQCLKSNLASDLPESMRMSDDEINGQTPTFLLAGHETTSTAVSWTLFALACHSDVQAQLRAELVQFPHDTPSMDDLNSLVTLDNVLREVLRLYAPVTTFQRDVKQDTTIPLGTPIVDKYGVTRSEISVAKGDQVSFPIRIVNRSVEIWGEDAHEFRPSRWTDSAPEAAHGLPSVYSNLMTFGAGAHACIGFRFSIIEAKAILFSIFRNFEVELAVEPDDIVRRVAIVGRPTVANSPQEGVQLPILIRPIKPT
ncbi:unnamed protein product [Peniophora sp. CBMAI 1063]|nr:unnamed protein product [Peniophora sp. CBMAI 1063]